MNLLNGSFEIQCPFIFVDQHPAIFAKLIQKFLLGFSSPLHNVAEGFLGSWCVCGASELDSWHPESDSNLIFPLGNVSRGATTGQKQGAGREYECDASFDGMSFV